MVVEQVWDTTTTDSMSEELAYFSGLKFAVPTATSQICAFPLQHMLDWLLNPHGPPLVEGEECNIQGHLPRRAFALLAVPRFLYGPGGMPSLEPMIGVGVVFIPPYVQQEVQGLYAELFSFFVYFKCCSDFLLYFYKCSTFMAFT